MEHVCISTRIVSMGKQGYTFSNFHLQLYDWEFSSWMYGTCSIDIPTQIYLVNGRHPIFQQAPHYFYLYLAAKKVIFKSCHSASWSSHTLAQTSFQLAPKTSDEQNWFHSSSVIWFPQKNFTCPSGKLPKKTLLTLEFVAGKAYT